MPCYFPLRLHPNTSDEVVVGCGQCPACHTRRIQSWVFRLQQEEKRHNSTLFFTLTYDDANLPWTDYGQTLHKPDLQNFFKRLRKNTGRRTIKYFACGEYGTDTIRPHYHSIIYDANWDEVQRAWSLGLIHQGDATTDSMAYVVSYINKPKTLLNQYKKTVYPEFSAMSKGLGKNYVNPNMARYHIENMADHVTVPGNYRHAMPRYYRDRIFSSDQRADLNCDAQLKFRTELEERIRNAGSASAYHHSLKEGITAACENFHRRNAQKRKL